MLKEVYGTSVQCIPRAIAWHSCHVPSSEQPPNPIGKAAFEVGYTNASKNLLPRSAALLVCHLQITRKRWFRSGVPLGALDTLTRFDTLRYCS